MSRYFNILFFCLLKNLSSDTGLSETSIIQCRESKRKDESNVEKIRTDEAVIDDRAAISFCARIAYSSSLPSRKR